jgi:hypothetical protein
MSEDHNPGPEDAPQFVNHPDPARFKVEIGRPLVPQVGDLSGTHPVPTYHLPGVPTQVLLEELTRRFQGVALVALQVVQVGPQSPSGAMELALRDMCYTSLRGIPPAALAGCVTKLAADLHKQAVPLDIKKT